MNTLTQAKPIFAALDCQCGRRAFDVLYPWTPREDAYGARTPFLATDILCPNCRIGAAPEHKRSLVESFYERDRALRGKVNLPGGTLLVHPSRPDSATKWARDISFLTYWVAVSSWSKSLPLKTLDLSAGSPPVVFVLVAALLAADRTLKLKQVVWAGWRLPQQDYRFETLGGNAPGLKRSDWLRLTDMVALFREFDPETIGHPAECFQLIVKTKRMMEADGSEPSLMDVAKTIHHYSPDPRKNVEQCIYRERQRTGRPLPWHDI